MPFNPLFIVSSEFESIKKTIYLILLLLFVQNTQAAWLNFIPQEVTQPDGGKLQIYASGDEFHHWLHDENGYTIVKDKI